MLLSMKPGCAQQSWRLGLQGGQDRSLTQGTPDYVLWSHSWEDALTCGGSWVMEGNRYCLVPMER